ncbi:GNAT family N-acetyltransferase [Streptomyces sp. NPDC029216]|uniref:GNAT family N-acetyltransferase n=1 Tax=Streptomyces sp. NPDC029216 TaxID=3154701 RepID=UPI0033F39203
MLIREPRPADEAAVVKLLERVEFTRPENGAELAHAAAHGHRLDPSCGVRAAWVAQQRRDEVFGVLVAAPPLGWIGSLELLSPEHRSWVAHQVVEMEALSVAPQAGGRRLGHRLIETAAAHYRGLGYRLMLGTFTTSTLFLVPYYRQAGFTVLEPGERIAVHDPLGMVLHRPADSHVVQMWKPLHRDVAALDTQMPDGSAIRLITGVLVPPVDGPQVVRNVDGSLTIKGGGRRQTLDAEAAEKLELMYRTAVSDEEVQVGMAEAARYGMEPLLAAKLRKASGLSLPEILGAPRQADAHAGSPT